MASVEQAVSQELPIISVVTVLIADMLLVLFLLKSTPCTVSEKKWDTIEGNGRFMVHALYVLWYPQKAPAQMKLCLNSEKIKPVTLVIVKLHLSEGIRQSLENSTK